MTTSTLLMSTLSSKTSFVSRHVCEQPLSRRGFHFGKLLSCVCKKPFPLLLPVSVYASTLGKKPSLMGRQKFYIHSHQEIKPVDQLFAALTCLVHSRTNISAAHATLMWVQYTPAQDRLYNQLFPVCTMKRWSATSWRNNITAVFCCCVLQMWAACGLSTSAQKDLKRQLVLTAAAKSSFEKAQLSKGQGHSYTDKQQTVAHWCGKSNHSREQCKAFSLADGVRVADSWLISAEYLSNAVAHWRPSLIQKMTLTCQSWWARWDNVTYIESQGMADLKTSPEHVWTKPARQSSGCQRLMPTSMPYHRSSFKTSSRVSEKISPKNFWNEGSLTHCGAKDRVWWTVNHDWPYRSEENSWRHLYTPPCILIKLLLLFHLVWCVYHHTLMSPWLLANPFGQWQRQTHVSHTIRTSPFQEKCNRAKFSQRWAQPLRTWHPEGHEQCANWDCGGCHLVRSWSPFHINCIQYVLQWYSQHGIMLNWKNMSLSWQEQVILALDICSWILAQSPFA